MDKNILDFETVSLNDEKSALVIIDQTLLPNEIKILELKTQDEIREAIYLLKVRGAPAIGVAAAIGIYLAAKENKSASFDEFYRGFKEAKNYLASSRPTAVNLFWALNRMEKIVLASKNKQIDEIKDALRREALKIRQEDISVCRKIGEFGADLLKNSCAVLTHCNAGQLATVKYGTALAPIYIGKERGYKIKVFADETRPLLQGARLTAFELSANGIDATLICDNTASQVMKNKWIDFVFVGCDRVAANGDICNKIGTSGLAVLCRYYNIPFYVCAPSSTIDMSIKTGADIPIEQRPPSEVTDLHFKNPIAPRNIKVYNPAFDVTDNSLVSALITEFGIIRTPYKENLAKLNLLNF
ncbi:MAG: S-methyl-5-thioribose-1-phosphate isomerase [Elusimicrobiota bacterium]|jgi:methylthioribose-1-phosphate isomerase|nr:S-methyl-5-thioribose-1-phosphate isomerase [Elusimicrobiota bacterium]